MKDNKTEMITIRVSPELLRSIVDWGQQENDLPSKPEVVRRMLEYAVKHRSKRK